MYNFMWGKNRALLSDEEKKHPYRYQEDELKLARRPKYSRHKWKFIIYVYGCLLFSLTLSLSLVTYSADSDENQIWLQIMQSIMYTISVVIILSSIIYLVYNNEYTYESAMKNQDCYDSHILFSLRGEKISHYLEFGVSIIGSFSILFVLLRIKEDFANVKCRSFFKITFRICECSFLILESVFIIKYNSLVMLAYHRMTKLILSHLIFTNVSSWIRIALTKLSVMYDIKTKGDCRDNVLFSLSWYLLPCVAEFSIISMVILYDMYLRVGKIELIRTNNEIYRQTHNKLNFRKILPGIVISIVLIFITFEVTIFYSIMGKKIPIDILMLLHMMEEVGFYLVGLVMLVLLFKFTRKLKFSFSYNIGSVDVNLLYISAFLSITYCMLVVILTLFLRFEKSNFPSYDIIIRFRSITAIVEFSNIAFQTFVIQDSFNRCCEDLTIQILKPKQNYVAVLIGINLSLWLLKALQMKKGDIFFSTDLMGEVFKEQSNQLVNFFLYSTMPLSILFRYHSTVCLAHMFSKMYEDESDRLETLIRAEGFLKRLKHSRSFENTDSPDISTFSINTEPFKTSIFQREETKPKNLTFTKRRNTIKSLHVARKRIKSSQDWHKKLSKQLRINSLNV